MNRKITLILALVLVSATVFAEVQGNILAEIRFRDYRSSSGSTGVNDAKPILRDIRQLTPGDIATFPQVSEGCALSGTLASGASVDIDLRGSLEDSFGGPADFVTVRGLIMINLATTALTLEGGSAAPAGAFFSIATGGVRIPGSGTVLLAAPINGFQIGSGTSDILKITNGSGGTGAFKLLILGNNQ